LDVSVEKTSVLVVDAAARILVVYALRFQRRLETVLDDILPQPLLD